jgi:crotonobetainyl-CoA:carnitine CoA-transferase CaiB-like acyl-CoA transferase
LSEQLGIRGHRRDATSSHASARSVTALDEVHDGIGVGRSSTARLDRSMSTPSTTRPDRAVGTVDDVQIDIAEPAGSLPDRSLDASHIALVRPHGGCASAFDVDGLLADTLAFAVANVDRWGADRGIATRDRTIDLAHLIAFCTTHVEVDGRAVPAWADLSGVYPTRDGRSIQIHCNFPHHADGVVRRLGCDADRPSVAAAIAERDAFELEAALIEDGMIGAAVRTLEDWDEHPHARATRGLPLLSVERLSDGEPIADRRVADSTADEATPHDSPLDGLRVLDCSRVLAGPVAGRLLASFGADVLRLGAEHLPSVPIGVMGTGFGKRNAALDLREPSAGPVMDSLLAGADVWIDAYRPGSMAELGFTPERAGELRPGIVVVQISAFDWTGPWAGRRGFDSIVQSTTGIRAAGGHHAVDAEGEPWGRGPIGLPVQALDYATGFLAAGAAAGLVAHQRRVGGSWLARLSLLRTRDHLVARRRPRAFEPRPVVVDAQFLHDVDSDFGRLTTVRPPVGRIGAPPRRLSTSEPRWDSERHDAPRSVSRRAVV